MSQQVIIEEHEMTPEMARLFEQAERNMVWFAKHPDEMPHVRYIFREKRSRISIVR